jgi:hypothetical protein
MKKIYVNDLYNGIFIFPLYRVKDKLYYLLVYHNELTFWQNVLCNIPICMIKKSKSIN